jgi:hypothetical protein
VLHFSFPIRSPRQIEKKARVTLQPVGVAKAAMPVKVVRIAGIVIQAEVHVGFVRLRLQR